MLFPSKDMQDWEKFSWRKGSVVVNGCGYTLLFEKWSNDIYTEFDAKYSNSREGYLEDKNLRTYDFTEVDDYTAYAYIREMEKKLNGKLNLSTLEIEKPKQEFKDGDIIVAEKDAYYDKVIFIAAIKGAIVSKALINVGYKDYEVQYIEYRFGHNRTLRIATDSEKKQLFDALAKKNKKWNPDTKQIEDVKKEHEFKPLDYVLIKTKGFNSRWLLAQYSFADSKNVSFVGGLIYCIDEVSIIPYNDDTKHLLGTADEWKGGEEC